MYEYSLHSPLKMHIYTKCSLITIEASHNSRQHLKHIIVYFISLYMRTNIFKRGIYMLALQEGHGNQKPQLKT